MADPTSLHLPIKEWVSEHITKDYKEIVYLTTKKSVNDPPEEPFRSLYAARELITGLRAKLDSCPDDLKEYEDYRVLSSCVHLELGLNYINGEELSQGEEILELCLRILDGIPNKVRTASVSIQALNQLGVLWGNRNEQQKALEFLLKAKAVYESHICLPAPITDSQWLLGEDVSEWEREKAFENNHTLTLFYLAQVYGNLKKPKLSAQYCQTTLSRQLETRNYDAIEWSLNCATISQYYMSAQNFPQSRHCLAAASYVLQQFKMENCIPSTSEATGEEGEESGDTRMTERLQNTEADISRCWTKYCIALLSASRDRQVEETAEEDRESRARSNQFRFDSLEVASMESAVSSDYAESYEDGKLVFLFCQKQIDSSKLYYTLEDRASEHVKVVQDLSNVYKLLAYFESSLDLKCRMHKRRIDMLTSLLHDLNPQYYLNEHREMLYEIGEVQSEMSDYKIILASDSPTPHAVGKINKLLQNSITVFEKFVASFCEPRSGKLPREIDPDYLRHVLSAKLNMARLFSKMISPDPAVQVRLI